MTGLQYLYFFFFNQHFIYTFAGTYGTSVNIFVQTNYVHMYLDEEFLG